MAASVLKLKLLPWKVVKGLALSIPPYLAFTDIFYEVKVVDGSSMEPTLNPNGKEDFVLLNRWQASSMNFERGDVVTLISPKDPSQHLIKRIVALEGDKVQTLACFDEEVTIPKGHCWVEGDNHPRSMDSNHYGPVCLNLVTAKATHIIWPPRRWGRIECENLAEKRVTPAEEVERGQMFFGWDLE